MYNNNGSILQLIKTYAKYSLICDIYNFLNVKNPPRVKLKRQQFPRMHKNFFTRRSTQRREKC